MAKRTHQNAAGGIALLACLSLFARPAPARAEAAEGAGCPTISQADLPVLSELDRRIAAIQTGGPHQSKFLGTFTGGVSHTSRALAQLESKVAAYCQKPDARDGAKLSGALTEISGYIQYQDDNFHYLQEHAAKAKSALTELGYSGAESCGQRLKALYQKFAATQEQNRQKVQQLGKQMNGCR